MRRLALILIIFVFGGPAWAALSNTSRDQAITELKTLKTQNSERLNELDERIKGLFESSGINAIPENEITLMQSERKDLLERQKLFDRLILQVDTKYKSGDIRLFLSERLSEMAKADMLDSNSGGTNWRQLSYLSQALRELSERNENVFAFVSGYLKQSKFDNPIKPNEFIKSREYTNGAEGTAAAPMTHDQAAESTEKQIQQIENKEN